MLKDSLSHTKKLVYVALLSAISIILVMVINFPAFPAAPYLRYDIADVSILLGTFLLGAAAGLEVLFVTAVIQAFLLGGDGIIGFLMHFVASGVFIIVAWSIYRAFGQKKWALFAGLVLGVLAKTLIMIPMNLIITVHAYGVPKDLVVAGLIPITIPYNLLKGALNAALFLPLYGALGYIFKAKKKPIGADAME